MKTLATLSPKTLLRLSHLQRVGAVIAAIWAFREVFEHRAAPAIGMGFGLWFALEIGAFCLREWTDERSPYLDRN